MLLMTYVKWSLRWVSGLNEQNLFYIAFSSARSLSGTMI